VPNTVPAAVNAKQDQLPAVGQSVRIVPDGEDYALVFEDTRLPIVVAEDSIGDRLVRAVDDGIVREIVELYPIPKAFTDEAAMNEYMKLAGPTFIVLVRPV